MGNALGTPHKTACPPDGCKLHPSCSTCPLPDCEYDRRTSLPGERDRRFGIRHKEARRLREQGLRVVEIAKRLEVTRARVYQYLQKE